MIRSFRTKETERMWLGESIRRIPLDVQIRARRKLRMLNNARSLQELHVPPGNRLEGLVSNRRGQHGIRINDQYRLCFVWRDGDCFDVEFTGYHEKGTGDGEVAEHTSWRDSR